MSDFTDLKRAWSRYREASRAMIAATDLSWPHDPRRDVVQGRGMRFHELWTNAAQEIRDLVAREPEKSPEFSAARKRSKGKEVLDPGAYNHAPLIMPYL